MCGRFAFFSPREAVIAAFGPLSGAGYSPRYNITPGQMIAVLRAAGEADKELAQLRWGLVPFWAKDPAIGNRMINARAETLAEKPSFRQAFSRRRCLVLADGFYEWQPSAGGKVPWYISRSDGLPMAFAGLWEEWRAVGAEPLGTCTIVTAAADAFMQPLHHRMPVIMDRSRGEAWLAAAAGPAELQALLGDGTPTELRAWQVSRAVNNPVNDTAGLIEAAGGPGE